MRRKLLLVGWDAADWKVIHPLLEAGKMPALQRLIDRGVMGDLTTLKPVLSPMLWTSIATGKRPFKHGIHGFSEPTPDGQSVRPITTLNRKTKALWNIFSQKDYRSNVIGWWPSHPVEPIKGVMVSNHFQQAVGPPDQPWPLPKNAIHPRRLEDTLAELRLNPNELDAEQVKPFIPLLETIDQKKDRRVASIAKIIAECTSIHAAATWAMQHEPWDFMAVYYDAIDHFCHAAMKYHPPQQAHIRDDDFRKYRHVVESGYRYHDMMLETLMDSVSEDTAIMLISDHGFHPDHLRPRQLPKEPAGPAMEHRDLGIFVMAGPGIKQDELIHGANLLDIAPTILTYFGLPVGADMDGKTLRHAFETPPEITAIPSWDTVEGNDGSHPAGTVLNAETNAEVLKQLEDLGYIDRVGDNNAQAAANSQTELDYNLARAYIDADRHLDALPLLLKLYETSPQDYRFGIQLAFAYRALNRIDDLRPLIERIRKDRESAARNSKEQLSKLAEIAKARRQQIKEFPKEKRPPLFSANELQQIRTIRSLAQLNPAHLDHLMAYVHTAEGNHEEAIKLLERALKTESNRQSLHNQVGDIYLRLSKWQEAEDAYRVALSIDPHNPHANLGVCRSLLPRKRYYEAAGAALVAVQHRYHFPYAHYALGLALSRLGRLKAAAQAHEVAISQNPNFFHAHARLAYLYERHLDQPARATEHRRLAEELRGSVASQSAKISRLQANEQTRPKPAARKQLTESEIAAIKHPIVIVSGLPRSGTSMMMQMLASGGLPAFTDESRQPDASNPRGYFEEDRVKRLYEDASWLPEAEGRVIKIVAPLLPQVPSSLPTRVIFMLRDLDEIIRSQRTMLDRLGKCGGDIDEAQLKAVYQQQLARCQHTLRQSRAPVLPVSYTEVIADPLTTAKKVADFLCQDFSLEPSCMESAVDKTLYRERSDKKRSA